MRLNYFILWIEDDDSWYSTTSELLSETVIDSGFHPTFTRKKTLDEVIEQLQDTGLKKYDILLIDFKLRNSKDGDSIIHYVRDHAVYTDIIFYSSDKQSIVDLIKENLFEGVYHSDRKEFEDKFEKVFKTTIKKIEELNSMRGLIVGETSELDALIDSHLDTFIKSPFVDGFDLHGFVEAQVFAKAERKMEFLRQAYYNSGIEGILSHLEAIRKWELLRGILKVNKKYNDFIPEFIATNSTYQIEVIDIRNKFAHAQVLVDEANGKEVLKSQFGGVHYSFGEDEFRNIRSNLIKHREALEKLGK